MGSEITELNNFDNFFFYGLNDISKEIETDLYIGLVQPKRSLFYDRNFGSGIVEYENYPNTVAMQVGLRYQVSAHVARENQRISDGSGGSKDRRVAVSSNSIRVEHKGQELNISVFYIPYKDYKKPNQIDIFLGGNKT